VRSHPAKSEAGETYVELLVTLVIVGLVAVAIMGGIMTSITSSSTHRNLANDETVLRSAVEQLKYQAELSPTPLFTSSDDCGSVSPDSILTSWNSSMGTGLAQGDPARIWPAIPSGILPGYTTPWISTVTCFSESAGSSTDGCYATKSTPTSTVLVNGVCNASDTSGILEVTVSFKDQSNLISSLSVVVRNPSYDANYNPVNFQ
jgi:type II secretory pathway pseudopilin PulG